MYGSSSSKSVPKKAKYFVSDLAPIKIEYDTVPSMEEWHATLRYREAMENAAIAPPPPPLESSVTSQSSPYQVQPGEYVPPPPPMKSGEGGMYFDPVLIMRNDQKASETKEAEEPAEQKEAIKYNFDYESKLTEEDLV